jgi:hypothetical protein
MFSQKGKNVSKTKRTESWSGGGEFLGLNCVTQNRFEVTLEVKLMLLSPFSAALPESFKLSTDLRLYWILN